MYKDILLYETYISKQTISSILEYIRQKKGIAAKFYYSFKFMSNSVISRLTTIGNKSRIKGLRKIIQRLQYDASTSDDVRFLSSCYNTIEMLFNDLKNNCSKFDEDCNKLVYDTETFLNKTRLEQKRIKEKVDPSFLSSLGRKLNVPVIIGLTALSVVGFKYVFSYLNISDVSAVKLPLAVFNVLKADEVNIYIKIIVVILLIVMLIGIYFLFKKLFQKIKSMFGRK